MTTHSSDASIEWLVCDVFPTNSTATCCVNERAGVSSEEWFRAASIYAIP